MAAKKNAAPKTVMKKTAKPSLDWKKLRTARGPAARVPKQVADLLSDDSEISEAAVGTLNASIYAPGQWYSASAPVVDLFVDVITAKGNQRFWATFLLADVIGGDHLHALEQKNIASSAEAKATRAAAVARLDDLLGALDDDDPRVRSGVAEVLAFIPEARDASLRALRTRFGVESVANVRGSIILALGVLGADRSWIEPGTDAITRGAAALATLLLEPAAAPKAVDLASLLHADISNHAFGWGRFELERLITTILRRRGDDVLDVFLSINLADDARGWERWARAAMEESGLKQRYEKDDVVSVDELSPRERALAERVAKTDGIEGIGWGIPSSGRVRRRWLGVDPPGPLEKLVTHKGRATPLWKVWRELYSDAKDGIPTFVRKQLTPIELAHALGEMLLGSYGILPGMGHPPLLPTIVDVCEKLGAAGADWAEQFGRELLPYFRGKMTPENGGTITPYGVQFLITIPMLRAGRDFPIEFAVYAPAPPPFFREFLEKIALVGRERAFLTRIELSDFEEKQDFERIMSVVDLVPTRAVVRAIMAKLDTDAREGLGAKVVKTAVEKLEQLAAEHPEAAAGLRDARAS